MEENVMPVILLWAVPAVIFVGGAGYFLVHMHWTGWRRSGPSGKNPAGRFLLMTRLLFSPRPRSAAPWRSRRRRDRRSRAKSS